MARNKRASDDAYNVRRRLKRQAAREAKKGNAALAENLNKLAASTYATRSPQGRLEYTSAALDNLANIRRYQREREITAFERATQSAGKASRGKQQTRRNRTNASREARRAAERAEARQVRARARSEQEALNAALDALRQNSWQNFIPRKLAGWQKRALFASSAHLWRGKSIAERERVIMDALGVVSLEEAYAKMTRDINEDIVKNVSAEEKYALTTAFANFGR